MPNAVNIPVQTIPDAPRTKRRLVVGIPAYNEEIAIGSVVLRARQFADEVVVVDDGSRDATARVAAMAGARVVTHAKNGGYGEALRTLFRMGRTEEWDSLVIIDSDGQHNPDEIAAVAKPVLEGEVDISIGSRFVAAAGQDNIPAYRKAGIKVLTELSNLGAGEKQRVTDGQSGFRVYSKRAIAAINPKDSDMGISAEILFQARKAGLTFAEVPIVVRYDVDGSSQHPVKHGLGVIGSIVKYVEVEHPLGFFMIPGLIALALGLLLSGYALNVYFASGFLPFGPTVGAAGLVLAGLTATNTGLILHTVVSAIRRR